MTTTTSRTRRRGRSRRVALWALLLFQGLCAAFFLFDVAASLFGLTARPIAWNLHELIQLCAALGLLLGTATAFRALRLAERRRDAAVTQLRVASGAFHEVIQQAFDDWGLSPAERDVALFSLKTMSISEIAALRGTTESTVKAQCASVYRKAGVAGRPGLLGHFFDSLLDEALLDGAGDAVGPAPGPAPQPARPAGR